MKFTTSLTQVITIATVALVSLSTNAKTVEVIKAQPVNKVEFKREVELSLATSLQQQVIKPTQVKFEMPLTAKTTKPEIEIKLPSKLAMIAE
ncbi:hypothetical protein [Thalassotalea fusca]